MFPSPTLTVRRRRLSSLRAVAICVSLVLAAISVAGSVSLAARANADPGLPDPYHMAMLVHSSVAALDQANRTGNYQVLRALAAPAFQRANTPERLSRIFAALRQTRVSLAPAVLYDPLLTRPARIDENGRLRLDGFFETVPMQIHFAMQFEHVAGRWQLFGISIIPRAVNSAT